MNQKILCCSLSVLAWTVTLFGFSYSVMYTSSKKIEDMVLQEEEILNDLHRAVNELGNETAKSSFYRFYRERMPKVRERRHDAHLLGYLRHPNGIYHSIKQFAAEYENIRSALEFTQSDLIEKHLSSIANTADIRGAMLSFFRLQDVYGFNTSDMIRGTYFEFPGPELSETDIIEIGEAAFNDNRLDYANAWLQEALRFSRNKEPTVDFFNPDATRTSRSRILALLGRVYLRQGHKEKAADMHRKARNTEDTHEHIAALERELEFPPQLRQEIIQDKNLNRLCPLQNKLTQKIFDPRLTCSYREVILPYYRIKEELVSVSPYLVLFYEVVTDQEVDTIMNVSRQKLQRGTFEYKGVTTVTDIRTSDLSFVADSESPVIDRLSKRVAAITGLNISPHTPGRDYQAEDFQVVNYGMGGHYSLHHDFFANCEDDDDDMYTYFLDDPFVRTTLRGISVGRIGTKRKEYVSMHYVSCECEDDDDDMYTYFLDDPFVRTTLRGISVGRIGTKRKEYVSMHYVSCEELENREEFDTYVKYGGNRMATFLIYLTDVERGGSTVFSNLDLSVGPVKKMVLFWYSYKPSGDKDIDTLHAGCPVVVGHKWVANKWIWLYGNTFTRRCGLTPDATQLDIEPYMRKRWV